MRLHVFPPSPRAIKVLAALHHLGLDCDIRLVDLSKGEQMKPEFAALNPNKRMPVLEDDGFVLWESNAIIQYMASKKPQSGLWPSEPKARTDVIRWFSWEGAHWAPACGAIAFERVAKKVLGLGEPDQAAVARGETEFHKFAEVLNGCLMRREWLVGNRPTVADFSVGAWMALAAPGQYPLANYPEIVRWYRGLEALPGWKKAVPPMPA
jgi:glutathione S-transferase